MSNIYDEYEAFTKKYKQEYGPRTIVLEQVGSFFEIYSDGDLIDMKEIGDILNIVISRKNKAIIEISRTNHLMAGFPLYTLKKFVNILVNNNYTVVLVEQVTSPPNPKRAVTQILSPGTRIDDLDVNETNNIMSIYIEEHKEWKTNIPVMCVGISIIDLSTGVSKIYETTSKSGDYNFALDETVRMITVYNPREYVIFNETEADVVNYLDLENKCVHYKLNKEILNINYQKELLLKIFNNPGLLPIHEYLNLERLPYATISYINLLQFSYQHNETILNKIAQPELLEYDYSLNLSYNSAKQLNILNLIDILNTCRTSIGKRGFKERLLNPIIDINIIQHHYDKNEKFLSDKLFLKIGSYLDNIYDLQRLYRKINLNKLNPAEFMQIDISFDHLLKISEYEPIDADLVEFIDFYRNILDFNELPKYHLDNISGSFFKKHIYKNIDDMQIQLDHYQGIFDALIVKLNETNDFFKLEYNEKDLNYIQVTSKRFNEFSKKNSNKTYKIDTYVFKISEFKAKVVGVSNLKLSHDFFDEINDKINKLKSEIQTQLLEKYTEFLKTIVEKYGYIFEIAIKYINDVDFYTVCAKNAFKFRYTKPIIDIVSKKSYIKAKNIRHPIVERINTQVEYIGNDIVLGIDDIDGMLLYGVNSAGKSTISKSIAIAIVMAQAGMYVPCDEMIYHPYKKIFTRIPTGDDLFRGLSTFSVEICELRNILKRADEFSLVCGDELASGTEQISGISIVSASIIQLSTKKTSFIFATHLHDLTKIPQINAIRNLKVYHLSVSYNENLGKLIYDRLLKEGQGSSLYGIEVCKSLNMGNEFLSLANQIRQEYMELDRGIVNDKKSRYNTKKYVDVCNICNEKASEVHHIKEQENADSDGFIDKIHKNVLHNLVNVCNQCHNMIHQEKIKIKGYVQTEDGIKLDVVNIEQIIKKLRDDDKSKTFIIQHLKEKYTIDISIYKLNKLLV